MKIKNLVFFSTLSIFLLSCSTTSKKSYTFDEDFGDLERVAHKNLWAISLDTSIVRSGKSSVKFEVRKGDYRINKKGEKSSRAELSTETPVNIGQEYQYIFSIYIPKDFPIEDNRLVIGQWWAPSDPGEINRSPAMALRFRNGKFYISIRTSNEKIMTSEGKEIILYETNKLALGQWNDFTFKVKWSSKNDGLVNAWLNKDQIIKYNGPVGYNDNQDPYFQFGIYRDETPYTYVIYFDEISVLSK